MNKYFDVKDKIYDITNKYPETIDILVNNGLEQLSNEVMRKTMGKTISFEMVCKTKNINRELLEKKLVEVIDQNRISEDRSLVDRIENPDAEIKVEGILPCPVQLPLYEGFESF